MYQGARFFWAVPDYVPATEIHSIADLARPDVMKTMNLSIQGIGAGAAITRLSEIAMDEYNLEELGYRFQPGSQGEWIAAHDAALAQRQRFIFPTWTPQYLNNGGRLRPLDDPLHVLGGENRGSLVAPHAQLKMLPERTVRVLSRIRLGIDGVTQMDWLVNVQKKTPLEAARAWMRANDALVSSWFAA
ncbi:glycine betaine ABC transporter substrate-binding protein [Caballeronia sp. LZ033]|uniref:glycine betaine ABC transporter substrate-binding protein n=1 Tax=Caballeronia sp. LZ033 TaxID=3038566 RepID=UPI0028624477|nr:glycine betaine ABC transporter substrate-binding protein [Caballeronia sp. LZ033]MDR5816794.1 glycine betaine ABC transporter substrate-binding protein [Caballeronia sp. LZ033]